jgi:predicted metal-binding transcription factor (methanogenesis marker protein 9)
MNSDLLAYLEMARLAMGFIPDDIVEEMDMSDEEFTRLREKLQNHLDNETENELIGA